MFGPTQGGPITADTPSSKPLANATFVVENEKGADVASFTTDDQGRFRVPLAPGHYIVSKEGKKSGIGHYGPFDVDVVAGKMTKVQWECDTGIRCSSGVSSLCLLFTLRKRGPKQQKKQRRLSRE